MSAMSNIVIADGAATPVNHTFVPSASDPASWRDSDAAKAYIASQFRITHTSKRSSATKGLSRVKFVVELPTMGTGVALPASEVDYTNTAIVEFITPNRGLKQERKDLRTLLLNLLSNAQVIDVVDDSREAY